MFPTMAQLQQLLKDRQASAERSSRAAFAGARGTPRSTR